MDNRVRAGLRRRWLLRMFLLWGGWRRRRLWSGSNFRDSLLISAIWRLIRRIIWRDLSGLVLRRVRLILVEVILWWPILYNRSLSSSVLGWPRCLRIPNGMEHNIKIMRFDYNVASPQFGHRLLRRVLLFPLLQRFPLRWFRPVCFEKASTEPLCMGSLECS